MSAVIKVLERCTALVIECCTNVNYEGDKEVHLIKVPEANGVPSSASGTYLQGDVRIMFIVIKIKLGEKKWVEKSTESQK